jgi:superfamily I DNA/RNA helicase
MSFTPSQYQLDIIDAYKNTNKNIAIQAVAGAGKTTTLLMLAAQVRRAPAVLCAFNSHIAKDISNKLMARNIPMEGRTIHSLGYSCVRDNIKLGQINSRKYSDIAKRWISGRRGYYPEGSIDWVGQLKDLLDFTRLTMANPEDSLEMERLIYCYDLDCDQRMLDALPELLESASSHESISKNSIDFTDMLWLPVKKNWEPKKYKEVFVDESQDLNSLQTEFIRRSLDPNGARIVFCGDPRQAIMAFAGADANSFINTKTIFDCIELPLTFCYRCGSSIIDEAKKYVSHIEVPEDAHRGEVSYITEDKILSTVRSGDVVLCRKTAPLIELCLSLIAAGVPARVRGRNMATKLSSHISKSSAKCLNWQEDFVKALNDYRDKEVSSLIKKNQEERIESFNDSINCIVAVYDPLKHTCEEDLTDDIEKLFSDELEGVLLSTVHRSKGLEWPRVFIYKPSLLPLRWKNQSKAQANQEINLAYVATTRAMNHLFFIKEPIK